MAKYKCVVCEFIYDEEKNDVTWPDLPEDWVCPVCASPKKYYEKEAPEADGPTPVPETAGVEGAGIDELRRTEDAFEDAMADIHQMAETGRSITEPMRTRKPTIGWDDVLIMGAQLATIPLNPDQDVNTETVIGPGAKHPLRIATPIIITHMSFGALSREAKTALAKGSAAVKTAMCSGEGGILPESFDNAYKYIFEYVPNRYSVSEDNLKKVDAVEIKFGQSAKPGMGGYLPGEKVTREIAEIRGFEVGKGIKSPAHFNDILSREDLKKKVDWLRDVSGGKPVGIKFAAGNVEKDLEVSLHAEPDFVTLDGRAGATGAAPKFVKASTSIPSIFAVYRARRFLDQLGAKNVSLIITGGLRVSSDFVKALALGADAVAIGTSALMAIGCQQYKICNTGKCPMGIATQDPSLRANIDVDRSARWLENYMRVSTEELKDFARLTGCSDVHKILTADLCTTNTEIANHTAIGHV